MFHDISLFVDDNLGESCLKTKKAQADKPGSVGCWRELLQQRLIIYLEQESPLASNDLPTGIERAARTQFTGFGLQFTSHVADL